MKGQGANMYIYKNKKEEVCVMRTNKATNNIEKLTTIIIIINKLQ